ncbi:MAG: signal peptidase II [Candidatus Coproplasma sp.]
MCYNTAMAENKKKIKLKVSFGKSGLILLAVFAVLLTADLVLKYCAVQYNWQFKVIPGLIEVVPVQYNSGAAFSFLNDKAWAQTFFIVLTFIMLALMVAAFLLIPKRFVTLKVAIVLVAAGAVGNLVDRLAFRCVRDFVDVWMFGNMACCNFADFWIVFGVILAVIDLLFLNEWAAFPLTKKAKAAQSKKKQEEGAVQPDRTVVEDKSVNTEKDGNSTLDNNSTLDGGEER